MKFKLLILFTFLSFFTWSKTGAPTLVFNGKGPFENSFSFRVNLCETEPCSISESQRLQQSKYIIKKLSDFIYKHFYNLGGQQVYRKISPSDLIGTIEYLSNDYSQNLGSSSWDKKEIIKFMNMI